MSVISGAMKRTSVRVNVEHQLVSPVDFNLVVEMEHWLWIILAALFFGKIESTTCFLFKHLNMLLSSTLTAFNLHSTQSQSSSFLLTFVKPTDCCALINHLY